MNKLIQGTWMYFITIFIFYILILQIYIKNRIKIPFISNKNNDNIKLTNETIISNNNNENNKQRNNY